VEVLEALGAQSSGYPFFLHLRPGVVFNLGGPILKVWGFDRRHPCPYSFLICPFFISFVLYSYSGIVLLLFNLFSMFQGYIGRLIENQTQVNWGQRYAVTLVRGQLDKFQSSERNLFVFEGKANFYFLCIYMYIIGSLCHGRKRLLHFGIREQRCGWWQIWFCNISLRREGCIF